MEGEAFGVLHGLEKFHFWHFVREVSVINDHKPRMQYFKKKDGNSAPDIAVLRIQQYKICILCKHILHLYLAVCLPRLNHIERKNEEISSITVNVNAIDITTNITACMTIQDIQKAVLNDTYL